MKAVIKVTLKTGVLDPQGKAIETAVAGLGITGVKGIRQGKHFDVDLGGMDEAAARAAVERMCKSLLANLVIENFSYDLIK